MRKLLTALALGLILMLAACATTNNGNEDTSQPEETGLPTDYPVQDSSSENDAASSYDYPPRTIPTGFTFATQGVVIYMDQDMAQVLEQLGEPIGVFEAPSCAFDGIDRIFRFPGVQIHTYPSGELDLVHTISIRDDSVTTMEGIYLGSSWEDVLDAYGHDYKQDFSMFTFTLGLTTLSFFVEDGIVTGITYGLIM